MPRVIGALVGDLNREPGASIKYGFFFEAVGRRFPLVGVYDASLQGLDRLLNALRTIHPNRRLWHERFHKNVTAFHVRSQRAAAYMRSIQEQVDVILQVGVLFDARWNNIDVPSVIYTDYTAHLAAQKPESGRSPFNPRQLECWIELERRSFERAAHICTRSRLVSDSIINEYGIVPERITVVGGGVNFSPLPQPVRHHNGDTPTVLFIGKDLYRKGGDLLLRAFAESRKQLPDARLIFLTGDPIPSDLPTEGVEVIAPTWKREMIAQYYQRANVLVLPSRLETWGDVLLEAMIYGLPCIGVSGQAMEEIIVNEKTGLIIPPENVPALSAALTRLLANPALRREWGKMAQQRAKAEYTWDKVASRTAEAIQAAANCTHKNG
ncbi:MAG TPA: glycosyltransferase family 4 protein [Anaerolineae bacterium]